MPCGPSAYHRIAPVAFAVILIALVAGQATAFRLPGGTPVASPAASPAASPVAPVPVGRASATVADRVTIHITDGGYRPSFVQATNGKELTITLVNDGTRPHGFTIAELDLDVTVQPGQTATVVIAEPPPGDFAYVSTLRDDGALRGRLTFYN